MPGLQPEDVYEVHAEFCRTSANTKRLKVLDVLSDGDELTVSAIQDRTGINQSTLSQHLSKMRDKGVLKRRKDGVNSFYSISDDRVITAFKAVQGMAQEKAAAER
jgi:ArsR family transcriptional regulator